jgi:hypothetical protein
MEAEVEALVGETGEELDEGIRVSSQRRSQPERSSVAENDVDDARRGRPGACAPGLGRPRCTLLQLVDPRGVSEERARPVLEVFAEPEEEAHERGVRAHLASELRQQAVPVPEGTRLTWARLLDVDCGEQVARRWSHGWIVADLPARPSGRVRFVAAVFY